jgi:hypothetical protein
MNTSGLHAASSRRLSCLSNKLCPSYVPPTVVFVGDISALGLSKAAVTIDCIAHCIDKSRSNRVVADEDIDPLQVLEPPVHVSLELLRVGLQECDFESEALRSNKLSCFIVGVTLDGNCITERFSCDRSLSRRATAVVEGLQREVVNSAVCVADRHNWLALHDRHDVEAEVYSDVGRARFCE